MGCTSSEPPGSGGVGLGGLWAGALHWVDFSSRGGASGRGWGLVAGTTLGTRLGSWWGDEQSPCRGWTPSPPLAGAAAVTLPSHQGPISTPLPLPRGTCSLAHMLSLNGGGHRGAGASLRSQRAAKSRPMGHGCLSSLFCPRGALYQERRPFRALLPAGLGARSIARCSLACTEQSSCGRKGLGLSRVRRMAQC